MAVRIKVGGVDRGDFRDAKSSLTWQDQVNGRGTLAVTFRSRFGEWRPEDGQEVSVERDDTESLLTSDGQALVTADSDAIGTGPTPLFGGILLEPSEREEVGSGGIVAPATVQEPVLVYECQASEYSCICDRRIVAAIYEQMTLGDIVRDLLENYLDGEGINSWGVVAAGPLVEKAIFADVTVTQALNQVCELTGYVWRVDQFRVMQVQPWEGIAEPVAIDGSMLIAGTVKVRPSREKYRNHQVIRAGVDLTDERAETLVGDGTRRAFATSFPIGTEPKVEVRIGGLGAWTEKTVGILGVETGFEWYWNVGQAQVSQDDAGTILTTADKIRITYRGQFPIKTEYVDGQEIAARRAVEGGSGIYQNVQDRPELDSGQAAIDTAIALIERYGKIGTILEARTRSGDFQPGQVVMVTLPRHNLHGAEMLVENVSAEYFSEIDEVWYTIRAISGDPFGGWQAYFRRLLDVGKRLVIAREGEVLALLRPSEMATVEMWDEVPSPGGVSTEAPESRIGIMEIGTGEIGAAA